MSGLTRQQRAPLPEPLREDVIELLSMLLLAEIARHPDAYRAGPEGGTTVGLPTVIAVAHMPDPPGDLRP
jgi:hypothetical protein